MEKINSLENSQFKFLKKLKQKKYREESGLYLAEGVKFLDFEILPEYIILKEGELEKNPLLKNKIERKNFENNSENNSEKVGTKILIFSEQLFNNLSSQENSQGAILVYKTIYSNLDSLGDNIVVLDKVADPGNLGTIIRLCDASGFKDIILIKGCVDIYNEKVVRSSMGSIFGVNFIYLEESEAIEFIEKRKYNLLVTALDESSIPYTEVKLSEKNAFVFGNEGVGVSKTFLDKADKKAIIPIYGMAESLNVAVASGIFLYKMREIINNEK